MRKAEWLLVALVALASAGLVLVPVVILFLTALNVGSAEDVIPRLVGLKNFAAIAGYPKVVFNTFEVAGLATVVSLVFGGTIAWAVTRTNMRGGAMVEQLMSLPYYVTPLVGALAWAELGSANGLINRSWHAFGRSGSLVDAYSPPMIALVMALFEGSVAFVMIAAAMKTMDATLEEASEACGGGRFQTLWRITIPLLAPAIAGTAIFVFAEMLGSFAVPLVLGLPARFFVLTTLIYNEVSQFPPNYPLAAALGIWLFLVMAGLLFLCRRLLGEGYGTIAARSFRSKRLRLSKGMQTGLLTWCFGYVAVAVVLPLLTLLYVSLVPVVNAGSVTGVTLDNYVQALGLAPVRSALVNSVVVGLGTAAIGVLFMGAVAWIIYRSQLPGARWLEYVVMFPQAIPRLVLGFAMLVAWVMFPVKLYGTLWLLLIAYLTVFLPLGVRTIAGVMTQIDRNLEECAEVCGASILYRLRTITLPLARPGLIAAAILLFIASVREVNSSIFLMGPKSKVIGPTIVESWQIGTVGLTSAMALFQVLVMLAAVMALLVIARRVRGGLGE